jgi:colanic acid/amylovoran biosynthesis glycosyltransferase
VRAPRYGEGIAQLITMGRLTEQKNHKDLVALAANLQEVYEDFSIEIAGEGDLKETLQELIVNVHVEDKVRLVGVQRPSVDFLKKGDIFVFPSLHEGLGLVLLEAMAVGVPIVAADIPAVNEVVQDGVTGFLYESEDIDELKEKIVYMLKNPDEVESVVRNARAFIESHYALDRMVRDHDMLYQEMLGNLKKFAVQY